MGKNERQACLKAIRSRYRRVARKSKSAILDQFCAVCAYHRKYAIKFLNRSGRRRPRAMPDDRPLMPRGHY